MRKISDTLQDIACEQLHEDVKRIPQDIEYIKEWLKKEPHLNARTNDQWILTFLRGCKYSLERTKEKIDNYYTIRSLCPEFFTNRDPFLPEIQEILKTGSFLPLPQPIPSTSERVILLRHGLNDPKNIANVFKTTFMISDILLCEDDNYVIAGPVAIQDMKLSSISDITQAPMDVLKKVIILSKKAYPLRERGVNMINTPSFIAAIMPTFKLILSEKIQKRMKIYSENETDKLYDVIPQSILPEEYGGNAGSLEKLTAEWKAKVESYKDWFLDDQKYGTDEKKRIGKPKISNDMFGIEGSFRSLNID